MQQKLNEALSDQRKGIPIVVEQQTVSQYLDWWVEEVVRRQNRPATYRSYEQLIRLHIKPLLGKTLLPKLSTQQVRSFLNQKRDSGLSARTVQYLHAVLRSALSTAVRDEVLARNVMTLVKPPRVQAEEVRPLSPDEARSFVSHICGNRLEALLTVAVSLGLRQGEALALRWRDIDMEVGTLRVRFALQRLKLRASKSVNSVNGVPTEEEPRTQIHLVEPKNKKSRRTIELPQVTRTALAEHLGNQATDRVLAGSKWKPAEVHCEGRTEIMDDFGFTTSIGTPLEGRNVTKRFQRILKAAGIPHHRFHDLRHTAATLLAVQGVHPKTIQSVLGWDQAAMVDRYTHFVDEMRKDAAEKMNSILKPVAVSLAVKPASTKAS
ncbi:MAG: site-specific integrase [Bryobacteraceae bacterium]